MLTFKVALYIVTIGSAFFFAFWEWKLRRRLTDEALAQQSQSVSDYSDLSYDIQREMRRERVLKSLPPEAMFKLKVIASFKFLFVAVLIVEVFFLQR